VVCPLTSLKSPTRGMWFLRCLPRTEPSASMMTGVGTHTRAVAIYIVPAVFQMVSWWASSRSRMGEMMTMPCSRAYCS
jgi:hypothetical protein